MRKAVEGGTGYQGDIVLLQVTAARNALDGHLLRPAMRSAAHGHEQFRQSRKPREQTTRDRAEHVVA
jgi:hypothetical protein